MAVALELSTIPEILGIVKVASGIVIVLFDDTVLGTTKSI